MSTQMYYVCLSHTPRVKSDEIGTCSRENLYSMRQDLARRDDFVAAKEAADILDAEVDFLVSWNQNRYCFFNEHATCNLGLIDEYNLSYSVDPDSGHDHAYSETCYEWCSKHVKPESVILSYTERDKNLMLAAYTQGRSDMQSEIYHSELKTRNFNHFIKEMEDKLNENNG